MEDTEGDEVADFKAFIVPSGFGGFEFLGQLLQKKITGSRPETLRQPNSRFRGICPRRWFHH
jgi:hypothetical protein